MAIGYKSNADGSGGAITSDAVPVVKINSDDSVSIVNDLIVENGTIVLDKASGGKTILKPSDDSLDVDNLTFPKKGLLVNEDRLAVNVPLSNITAYHLLEGNLSVSNTVSTNGFSTTLYTGNGGSQSINTGVDMNTQWGNDASERFGGLVWVKGRSTVSDNNMVDTIRGSGNAIFPNLSSAQVNAASNINNFLNNGFTTGSSSGTNASSVTYASWNFQTTHRRSGTTNHGMTYTEHYNPFTGFTIIQYFGSGIAGHEIPHSLGRKLDFVTVKNIELNTNWLTYYKKGMELVLNLTNSEIISSNCSDLTNESFILGSAASSTNNLNKKVILYGWANSYLDKSNKLIGNYEIGTYTGTGLSGNKVKTKGKPAWLMVKRLDTTGDWFILDNLRGASLRLSPNLADIENGTVCSFEQNSFTFGASAANVNVANGQYLYMVVYDNDSTSGKSKYPKAQDTSTLNINNAKIPFANGLSVNGTSISALLRNEVIAGLTLTAGKNYVYMKNDGTYGVTPYVPNYDMYSGFGDYFDSKKNKWYKNVSVFSDDFSTGSLNPLITKDADTVLTITNGKLVIEESVAGFNYTYVNLASLNLVNGKRYRFKINCTVKDYHCWVRYNSSEIFYTYYNTGLNYGDFTYISGVNTIDISDGSSGSGTVSIDNISIYPINQDGTVDISLATEIPESRNYLNHIVYADHNGQVTYVEELAKSEYKKDSVITDKLTLQNVESINSNGDYVYKINNVEKMRVKEDGSILNQDGLALSSGGFKNYIINGAMDINQRYGTSMVTQTDAGITDFYFNDRWKYSVSTSSGGTGSRSIQLVTDAPNNFLYSLQCTTNTALSSSRFSYLLQFIEGINFKKIAGKIVTLTFWAKCSKTAVLPLMICGTPVPSGVTVDTSWKQYKVSVKAQNDAVVDFGTGQGSFIQFVFNNIVGAGDYIKITGVQLEEGSVATAFEQRPYGLELALCQRYYEVGLNSALYNSSGTSQVIGTGTRFRVNKRVVPTMTKSYAPATFQNITTDAFELHASIGTGLWLNQVTFTADAEL